ncbi:MAG: glycosyltransferase family 39 protein [Candidatus Micrarchaeia archaeon]
MAKKSSGKAVLTYSEIIAIVIMIAILVNAAYYAFTHFEGPSAYGDDPNYLYLASTILKGDYSMNAGYIFSLRIMQFLPIAFFYSLFGINNLASTMWDITAYLGIIIVTFFIVKLFYKGYKEALISSFVVSISPLIMKFAVNTGEDPPLTFISALAVLMFLYAENTNKKAYFFASGALLVVDWLISYEAGVAILFILVYAIIELLRKKITINYNSIFFIYGIAVAFLLTFIFSFYTSSPPQPFLTITRNMNFYSGVGTRVNGLPTIPTTNTNLNFYPNLFFQYHVLTILRQSPNIMQNLKNIYDSIFMQIPSDFGITYYYLVFALITLLVLRDKRSYFIIFWYAFMLVILEFGPMHVGITLHPFSIDYLLTYRLGRFMMITVPAMSSIIGIAISKLIQFRNKYLLSLGAAFAAVLLIVLYLNSYAVTTYAYYWQYYQESLVMPAANFLRYNNTVDHSAIIYLEATWHNVTVTYTGANFDSYYGDPSSSRIIFDITNTTNCNAFQPGSYVVWSGPPHCSNWVDIYNMPPVQGIPQMYINAEKSSMVYIPTNIYFVK